MRVLMILALAFSSIIIVVLGQNEIRISNCTLDSVAYAAAFLQNQAKYISNLACYIDYEACIPFEYVIPKQICARELNNSALSNRAKIVNIFPQKNGDEYFKTLQDICCIKTKAAEYNKLTQAQLYSFTDNCLNRSECNS